MAQCSSSRQLRQAQASSDKEVGAPMCVNLFTKSKSKLSHGQKDPLRGASSVLNVEGIPEIEGGSGRAGCSATQLHSGEVLVEYAMEAQQAHVHVHVLLKGRHIVHGLQESYNIIKQSAYPGPLLLFVDFAPS